MSNKLPNTQEEKSIHELYSKNPNLVTIQKAAIALKVSKDTLRRWEAKGKISSIRTTSGYRLYDLKTLSKAIKTRPQNEQSQPKAVKTPIIAPFTSQTPLITEHKPLDHSFYEFANLNSEIIKLPSQETVKPSEPVKTSIIKKQFSQARPAVLKNRFSSVPFYTALAVLLFMLTSVSSLLFIPQLQSTAPSKFLAAMLQRQTPIKPSQEVALTTSKPEVLAESSIAREGKFLQLNLDTNIIGNLAVEGEGVFTENITAPNILYSLVAGNNISITGDAQNPTISTDLTLDDATTTTKGIASFSADFFTVAAGAVSLTDGSITNTQIKDGTVSNTDLTNPSITINTAGSLTGGGSVSLGGSITLTGAASGVTSITGTSNQVIASDSTGAITLSLPQDIATTSSPTFASLLVTGSTSGTLTLNTAAITTSYTLTLPADDGTSGYVLQTDGSGNTSWVAQSGGATTLQGAYDGGNTIATTTGRNIAFTLASGLASSTSFSLTNAGTANAFILNDTNAASNISLDIQSSGTSSLTITEAGTIATSGNISTSGSGTVTSAGTLTASNGFIMSTGALSVTSTSGSISSTGLTALTYTLSSGTAAITAPTLNLNTASTGNTSVGNATGTFAITSNGGLNVTTGGALTGVASIDTIAVSSTALTFAAGGTMSATSTGLNLQADGTVDVNIAGGNSATGCTITNSNGNLACTGTITSNGTVLASYWTRTGTTLTPATSNDIVSVPTTNTTGADLAVTNTGVYTGTGIFNLTANSATTGVIANISGTGLTSGNGLVVSGSSATPGQTGALVKITGNTGRQAANFATFDTMGLYQGLLNSTTTINSSTGGYSTNAFIETTNTPTSSANSAIGLRLKTIDAAALANSNWGIMNNVVNTGAISTGTKTVIGMETGIQATGATGGTTTAMGIYIAGGNVSHAANSGSVNQHQLYIENGTSSTNGTSTKRGISLEPMTGADTNYGICFDCDGTWSVSSVASGLQFGTDANAVNLYRNGSDTLQTDDNLAIAGTTGLTFTGTGGQINFTNGETIDNDTDNQVNIGLGASGSLLLTSTTTASITNSAGALNINAQATGLNLQADGSIDVNIAGGSGSTGCTVVNSSGNLTCTGNIIGASTGTAGYWSRSSTTLSPATANDIVSIANTNTTGADLAVINTGVYTGTGIFNLTANSATTGTVETISATGLTTGKVQSISATNTATTNTAITQALYSLTNAQSTLANSSFVGLGLNFTNNPSIAGNTEYAFQIQNQLTANITDNVVSALLRLDNADTVTTGSTVVTNGLLITNSGGLTGGFTNGVTVGSGTDSITTGLNLASTGITNDISLQNGETIDNDVDGTINLAVTGTSALKVGSTGISSIGNVAHTIVNSSGALAIDSNSTGAINIGTGANAKTITMGNATGATALALTSGTGAQTFTSSVTTGATTASAFVFNASSLSSGTALRVTSTSTSGKLVDLNATNTSGTIFNLAYGTSATLTGDTTGLLVDLNSGTVVATNQNLTGVNFKIPTVTNTVTTGTKTLTGMLVNFGSGAGINQNGAGGTLEYIAGDFQMPALTQTAGTLNAYGTKVTTPATITTGGTAYGHYVNATGVGAGTLSGIGISNITGGSGTEYALNVAGTGWDAVLRVGSTTVINGSGITQVSGGGTGLSTVTQNGVVYGNAASNLGVTAAGTTGQVLIATTGSAPSWGSISGSTCTNCLVTDPAADQTIAPTGQGTTGLTVRQTSTASPTDDIFQITNSDGTTKYFYVDNAGNVSTTSTAGQTLTLTPTTDTTALTLVGTNVTTQPLQYINAKNSSATSGILNMAYGAAHTLTGTVIGFRQDLSTNVTATNQSVTGYQTTLPAATNTNTSGTVAYKGLAISGGALNANGTGGATTYSGLDITIPALTQTLGTLTAYGANITTPSSITTGGTAYGYNVAASGVGAGSLYGLNISDITPGAGTEVGAQIGSGWDTNLLFNDTTSRVALADGGTLTILDTSGNSLCTLTDAGSAGNLSCSGTISGSGSVGFWSRTGTTLTTATASDNVTVDGTTTANGTFDANGQFDLGDGGDAGTISATTLDIDATGALQINSSGGAISIGNDAVAQNINVGTGAAARTITIGNSTSTTALAFNSGTGSQTFTSQVTTGTTTTSAFVFDATALTSGTGSYLTSDSITTGKLLQVATTGNTLTSGTLTDIRTTSTALTGTAGTGSLINLDWTPGSSTTATGDLFALNIGANGSTTGNLFNILDSGSSIFSVSETSVTTSLPTNFTSPGDVSIAYDLNFTNPVASYIKSYSALTIQPGDPFGSSNLTLSPYNEGSVYIPSNVATAYGVDIDANLLSSGAAMEISSTSTAGTASGNSYLLSMSRSGANSNATHVAYGINASVLNTGTTSVNIAGAFTASGASLNYALATGVITSVASGTNYQLNLGAIAGAASATSASINTGAISGAGTASYGINLGANSATATSNYGINIGAISGAGTTNRGIYIGAVSGATNNYEIAFAGTSPEVAVADGGTITISDGTNTLCTIADAGTTGNLTCTGNITGSSSGTAGFWTRTSTTLSPATANDIVSIANTTTTGADLAITNTGVYTGTGIFNLTANAATTGDLMALSGTALTTGSLMTLSGPSGGTAGLTDSLLKLTSDIGNTGVVGGMALLTATIDSTAVSANGVNLNVTTTNSNSTNANTAYGIFSQLTDSTSLANTNIGISATASSGGNAAKTLIGVNGVGTSVSTTADNVYGVRALTDISGIITSGTRNVYGVYSLPLEYSASTGGTTNLYGVRSSLYADGAAGSTYNGYSLYVANGTFDTDGTTTQIGLALEPLTGADTNIGICFDCDGTYSSSTVASGIQFGTDANAVTLYRSASDILRTGDGLTVDQDLIVSGGDVTGANDESIDIGEAANGTISLNIDGTSGLNVGSTGISSLGNVAHTIVNSAGSLAIDSATTGAINIGTGANAKTITIGNATGATALAFNSGTGSQTFTSQVVSGTTTTSAFVFDSTALTTGTGSYFTSDSLTQGKLLQIATTGNTLTTGTLADIRTTATSLTGAAGVGSLMNLDWSPGSSTTATGDLFALNIGTNGSTTGNLFNILDTSASIFSISETALTTSLPSNFTAAGDVAVAYDINFTNPTASYIKSAAPLTIVAGETFNSSNLTLGTYNQGTIVLSTNNTTTTAVDLTSNTLTTGTGMNLNFGAITTGTGLAVSTANNTHSTGTLVTIASSSTAQTSGGLLSVVQSGVTTGFTGDVMRVVGSGTTGTGGTVLSITGANTTAGTVLEVIGNTVTTTNGRVMTLTANGLSSGIGVNISSSSTISTGNLINISQTGTSTQQAAATVAMSTTATTNASARLLALTANGMTGGTVQSIGNTATAWAGGTMLGISKTGATGNTAFTGDIQNITYSHTFDSTGTLDHTGNVLDMSRALSLTGAATQTVSGANLNISDSLTVNNASGTFTYTAPTVSITRAVTRTSGAITNSGNLMTLTSSDASHTGSTLSIADSATHASGGSSLLITSSAITSGAALTITGPTATGVTSNFVNVTTDVGSAGSALRVLPDFSGSAVTGYGLRVQGVDSTSNANVDYAFHSDLDLTGNAAKAGYAIFGDVSSTSTTADSSVGVYGKNTVSAGYTNAATRLNYGVVGEIDLTSTNSGSAFLQVVSGGTFNANSSGAHSAGALYLNGIQGVAGITSATSGSTNNVYAVWAGGNDEANTVAGTATLNYYGIYVENPSMNTTGTTAKYGMYLESVSTNAADTNYAIYSAGGQSYFAGAINVGDQSNTGYSFEVYDNTSTYAASISNLANSTSSSGLNIRAGTTTAGTLIDFRSYDNTPVGSITITGATTSNYGTSSDRRLKENIVDTHYGLNDLMKVQVRDYNFIADGASVVKSGFIAQDLYNIYPEPVSPPTSDDRYWMVDYGKMTPLIVKSVQELNHKVENALLTINPQGQASSLNVSKITVSGDIEVGGIVRASDYSLNASDINRVGVLASLPVDQQNRATVTDTLNLLAQAANEQESRIATLQAKEASTAAAIADAQILGEQALDQTASLQESVASTSSTIANLSSQIEELFASITGDSNPSTASNSSLPSSNPEDLALTPPTVMFASDSATLDTLTVNSQATISGQLTAYDGIFQNSLKSLGDTFLGKTNIAGDLSVDGTFSVTEGSKVNALPILYFQTSALAEAVDFFNGLVTITKDGAIAAKEIITERISVKANSSAGTVVLTAGETEMPVLNELVEGDSIIILTSETTGAPSLAVADKVEGAGFVVKLGAAYSQDIKFSYLIVGQK